MGSGFWSNTTYAAYSSTRGYDKLTADAKSVKNFFGNDKMPNALNPKNVRLRESRDSEDHPESNPIIVALDVTGSMGALASSIAKDQLNELMLDIYKDKPVVDPQVMFMMIGDHKTDHAPLQVSQFESDIRIAEQMTSAWFEGAGGGNGGESYLLAWYFATRHVVTDAWEKRKRKGFLFSIGDEKCHESLDKRSIADVFGDDAERDYTAAELLEEAKKNWEVYHLVVGNYEQHGSVPAWKGLLGDHVIIVDNDKDVAKVILETISLVRSTEKNTDPYVLD